MSSEEDVLFQVNHVKYKKDEGTLYMMSERIAWIQENRDTVALSHHYADIKSQKISPEGKPKIQLQIVLYDNATFTFQFVEPQGPTAQIRLRNQVKEHLSTLLPRFKRKLNPELEEKNKVLGENPRLMQLYRDLVMTDILTSEEFWKNHAPKFVGPNPVLENQETGVSTGFLTGIQPSTDGVNGIVYNLTGELMESIFRTYPAVRKKHKDSVPLLMTETEFWAKFFQSHYFHRDRLPVSKDLFYTCSKSDEKEMRNDVEELRRTHRHLFPFGDEKEGEEPIFKNLFSTKEDKPTESITAHRNMIKRFNQHSIMLLKSSERTNANPPTQPQPKKKRKKDKMEEEEEEVEKVEVDPEVLEAKWLSVAERMELEDLKTKEAPELQKLDLCQISRYLNGPVPLHQTEILSHDDIGRTVHGMREAILRWNTKPYLLDSKMAATLIGELSPGGAIMKTNPPHTDSQVVPPDIEIELRNTYISISEVLGQFWSSFPVTTPALSQKLKRSQEAVKKFEEVKLQEVKERLLRDHLPLTLMSHLSTLIAAAESKYNRWLASLKRSRR